ncbi:DUF5702 domain-containing protein [Butyrivibrio sp. AE2005]|uniref:DUF5702 domain-containing protein n=1 Tax=Butyrivibrio sp. AE2005 TaxID=1496722 RepID=UPI0012DE9865|nr:DUF5702 domain-containing protein [Butyrivibrio sp. AE2005]
MLLRTKGYLTVFLSLTITMIMSLILALYSGARIGAVKMKTECVADIAMNSVLAEYSRELYRQYGLLMVDTSYGTGSHSITNTEEHLRKYAQKNFEPSTVGRLTGTSTMMRAFCKDARITGSSFATDNDGAVLNRQILAYMSAEPAEGMLTDVDDNIGKLKDAGLDTTDVDEMARENQEEIDSLELPTKINEDGEEEEVSLGNPADAVNSQRGIGVLSLAAGGIDISRAAADLSNYASNRTVNKGTGLRDYEEISASEKLLIDEYLCEKCGRYSGELEKSLLKYQLEYLIFGQNSDYRNLEKMAQTLFFWRQASNWVYMLGCSSKQSKADAVASALTAVLMAPEFKDPVKWSIIFAWVFAESVSDVNILLEGGRVPLFKSDSTWQLGLGEMLLFRENLGRKDCGEGLYYKDYLRMKLGMTDLKDKTKRLMDIIEMDVRRTAGNGEFMIDHCLDTFCGELTVGTGFGYEVKIERVYGYEE